ncbi:MAG TPA: zf-HC2 domain-containing protein [Tepidisphaeraceae bacterium]|jgi:anti-sigma factor RsiW
MCPNESQVHAYHDGELPSEQRVVFEAHLATCAECRELLAELKGLTHIFAEVPLAQMSPRAMGRMYGSWNAAKAAGERGIRQLASLLTAAAAVVLVMVSLRNSTPSGTVNIPSEDPASTGWVETVAVMPPLDPKHGSNARMVQLAEWMASDLSSDQTQ